mgnify:CR=1 FL=1
MGWYVFFQAEDGIRDLVRSRGLGDVYKRQGYSKYGNVDAKFTNVNDSRAVTMSFTYRFNKGKLKAGSNRKNLSLIHI